MRIERFDRRERNSARELRGRQPRVGGVLVSRRLAHRTRRPRPGRRPRRAHDPRLPPARRARGRRRELVLAQALAPEPRRRRRARGRRRVRQDSSGPASRPPGRPGIQIANVAKAYAGTNDAVGTTYNKNVNDQSQVTVAINATSPTAARLDGRRRPLRGTGGAHTTGDGWSSGGLWTDVKVREGNIGTLFGSFGISLPQIAAQARVKVEPIIGVAHERPAVRQRDRRPDRVCLGAVRARAGRPADRLHGEPSNPILAHGDVEPHVDRERDEPPVHERPRRHRDPLLGREQERLRPCTFNASNGTQGPLPHQLDDDLDPVQIDWLNVYDTGASPGNQAPPKLRRFSLTAVDCGGPGSSYTASTRPVGAACRVGFPAEVDTGANDVAGRDHRRPDRNRQSAR